MNRGNARLHWRRTLSVGLTVMAIVCGPAVPASTVDAPPAAETGSIAGAIDRLKPGASLWAPDIAPEGPVTIVVSTALQRAIVYRNGVPIAVTTVSTGRAGHETPLGVFTILQKKVDHRSNLYDDAPMPFMQRLTWDGVALHAGDLPGYPASHGCIRLPKDFARRLYAITRRGAVVIVTDEAVQPEVSPTASPPTRTGGTAPDEPGPYQWTPTLAPSGPVSIVVSGRDRRLVVLRNGVVIGNAPIAIEGIIPVTSAFVLRSIDDDGEHWFEIPLPGAAPGGRGELTADEKAKGRLPVGFAALLASVMRPGVTMLVTRDSLATSGIGRRLRVMEGRSR